MTTFKNEPMHAPNPAAASSYADTDIVEPTHDRHRGEHQQKTRRRELRIVLALTGAELRLGRDSLRTTRNLSRCKERPRMGS
jgi:hypothetical protein